MAARIESLIFCWMLLGGLLMPGRAQVGPPRLEVLRPADTNGWLRLNSSYHTNAVLTLFAATNLGSWEDISTVHEALQAYPDAGSSLHPRRFYRVSVSARQTTNDWKNQVSYPAEIFRSTNISSNIRWVKFSILLGNPTRVYYQDSRKYPFHYDYATLRLQQFLGMDRASFDAISLHRDNQQVVLGTVLYPPLPTSGEYGIQFVGLDAYTPEEIARWFKLVNATIHVTNKVTAYYMPVFEQSEVTRTNGAAFAALEVPVVGMDHWVSVDPCYSQGWALGRLKFFSAAEVAAAYSDGRLGPGDILLTDGVPADTPLVAGILTLTPSTPNSHTAILSQSFGIPFAHLADPGEQLRVGGLVGHKVLVRATTGLWGSVIKVVDVEDQIDPALEAELLAVKLPSPINFQPKQTYGAFWATVDNLVPGDIQFFGGKAANFGLLRRSIPTNCPTAIAFSFDLWDAFLDQVLPGGQTLRDTIGERLAPYTNYPPHIPSLKTNLAAIRDLFTRTAQFTPDQQQVITNALIPWFNPRRNIRFRSSTNVEDSESFTGAGLYDSYSGCLADDIDGDAVGPCQCDPAEVNERGVFRAIRKVYASFYNDDAVLERLLHRVNESKVAMGVLVHHSFPDEEELANGVATPKYTFSSYSTNVTGDMVTQLGAESVTNPDGTSVPEVVHMFGYNSGYSLTLGQHSSRVPLGAYVMDWEKDYQGFMQLFARVSQEFRRYFPSKNPFTLDFEFKKDINLGLVVKQVRELPKPASTNQTTAWLIDEPVTLSVMQAEGSSVFANHRLKSIWDLHTANMRLNASNLVQGIYTTGRCEYVEGAAVQGLTGPLSVWPNAYVVPSGRTNGWTTGSGATQRSWQLETSLTTSVSSAQPPVLTQGDFPGTVTVTYATPVPTLPAGGLPTVTSNERVWLEPQPVLGPGAILNNRILVRTNLLSIETSFYWPKTPEMALIYTAPLLKFAQTRITGLTSSPITLTNYYSQTYTPGHHNFSEEFIFEPQLEPGLPAASLEQLNAANIRLIYAHLHGNQSATFYVLGFDGKLRPL